MKISYTYRRGRSPNVLVLTWKLLLIVNNIISMNCRHRAKLAIRLDTGRHQLCSGVTVANQLALHT